MKKLAAKFKIYSAKQMHGYVGKCWVVARKCSVMFGFCTEMFGFGYGNVLLCLQNLVYNVFVNAENT